MDKLKEFFSENPIKFLTLISIIWGSFYLIYIVFCDIEFLPFTSLNNITILSIIFFIIAFLLSSFILFLIIFPAEFFNEVDSIFYKDLEIIKKPFIKLKNISNKIKYTEKIKTFFLFTINYITNLLKYPLALFRFIAIIFIEGIFYFLSLIFITFFYFSYKNNIPNYIYISIIALIILLIILTYYQVKTQKKHYSFTIFLIMIIMLFSTPLFTKIITKKLKLSNYKIILLINNQNICEFIKNKKSNDKTCYIEGKVIWRTENEYILKINNKKIKIPISFIESEIIE